MACGASSRSSRWHGATGCWRDGPRNAAVKDDALPWLRRAQPLLGTLVEIGLRGGGLGAGAGAARHATFDAAFDAAFGAAFSAIREVQACLSRFEPDSDIARFNALRAGGSLSIRPTTRHVLQAARELQQASAGAFDVSLGSAPDGWRCEGDRLHKLAAAARLDLGGIGKGHAVDCAVDALIAHAGAAGWVNAGGDLRAFGAAELPIRLRDERAGGTRPFASLCDGAFATSHYGRHSRSHLARRAGERTAPAHVSVAAPLCLWADALTKVVAISGDTAHPLLARFDAQAWLH